MPNYLSPEWEHAALLTIDVQQDFTLPDAPGRIAGTMEVVPKILEAVQAFRRLNKPIIHVVRLYKPDGSNVDPCRRAAIEGGKRMALAGTAGAELVDALKLSPVSALDANLLLSGELQNLGPNEWVMYKPRWGAFFGTALEAYLQGLDVTTVVFCGCNFPNCPRATLYEASERDLRVVLLADAVSGAYDRGLKELENIGASVITTGECIAALTSRQSG